MLKFGAFSLAFVIALVVSSVTSMMLLPAPHVEAAQCWSAVYWQCIRQAGAAFGACYDNCRRMPEYGPEVIECEDRCYTNFDIAEHSCEAESGCYVH